MRWFLLWRQFVGWLRSLGLALAKGTPIKWAVRITGLLTIINKALTLGGYRPMNEGTENPVQMTLEKKQATKSPYDGLTKDAQIDETPQTPIDSTPRRRVFKKHPPSV